MAHTDKTTPYRVVAARGDCDRAHCTGYPCRHVSITGSLAVLRKRYVRKEREAARLALARGDEPANNQHRHRALWDAV